MRTGVLWTNLSLRELSRRLLELGTPASRRVIRRLLRQFELGRRTARNKKTMGHHPDRNAQFENIARLRREYQDAGDPVISIDTKKKELLGNFHRPGQTYTAQTVETFDHDFSSAGQGKLIPHGSYDLASQPAHINLNTSHDTGELCCDSVALCWSSAWPIIRRIARSITRLSIACSPTLPEPARESSSTAKKSPNNSSNEPRPTPACG